MRTWGQVTPDAHFGAPDLVPANVTTHYFRPYQIKTTVLTWRNLCLWNSCWSFKLVFLHSDLGETDQNRTRRKQFWLCCYQALRDNHLWVFHVSAHFNQLLFQIIFQGCQHSIQPQKTETVSPLGAINRLPPDQVNRDNVSLWVKAGQVC